MSEHITKDMELIVEKAEMTEQLKVVVAAVQKEIAELPRLYGDDLTKVIEKITSSLPFITRVIHQEDFTIGVREISAFMTNKDKKIIMGLQKDLDNEEGTWNLYYNSYYVGHG